MAASPTTSSPCVGGATTRCRHAQSSKCCAGTFNVRLTSCLADLTQYINTQKQEIFYVLIDALYREGSGS